VIVVTPPARPIDPSLVADLAALPLGCLRREYPSKLSHLLRSDADAAPPRALTPIFYGCFDWHSAVHGHWTLVRLLRIAPSPSWAPRARALLAQSFQPDKVAGERAYLAADGRAGFEMPYGMAWLLTLAAELATWDDPDARRWRAALAPLEEHAAARFRAWLAALPAPIRVGEHGQSALSMGLALDYARATGAASLAADAAARARAFHAGDRDAPLAYEPSAYDFLSPTLGVADLMRRVLEPAPFAAWLTSFAPALGRDDTWPQPQRCVDPADGKLAHADGLNLSRAWMLRGVAAGLPADDPRRPALTTSAERHAAAGLAAVGPDHYAGAHWLASFAVYWLTGSGLP
jgi:hypothetical protein